MNFDLVRRGWEWFKAVTGEFLILAFVWGVVVHGTVVFLPSLITSFIAFGQGMDYTWPITLWSLVLSSPAVIITAVTKVDEEPFLSYLIGGFLGGIIGSVLLIIFSLFADPTPQVAVKYVAGFAFAIGIIISLWGVITNRKFRQLAAQQ